MKNKEVKRNIIYVLINVIWLIVCGLLFLQAFLYKDVPLYWKHVFDNLRDYIRFEHIMLLVVYLLGEAAILILILAPENKKKEIIDKITDEDKKEN